MSDNESVLLDLGKDTSSETRGGDIWCIRLVEIMKILMNKSIFSVQLVLNKKYID